MMNPNQRLIVSRGSRSIVVTVAELQRGNEYLTQRFAEEAAERRQAIEMQRQVEQARAGKTR